MKERIKELRKSLGLTQLKFAERIGMKPNTIATYEMGRSIPSDPAINNICKEFSVNEEWLRTGEGEMFIQPDTFSLDEFARERGMTELELGIIKVYFNLPPPVRGEMLADLKKLYPLSRSRPPPTAPRGNRKQTNLPRLPALNSSKRRNGNPEYCLRVHPTRDESMNFCNKKAACICGRLRII